jgi:hypothetical protein
LYQLTRQAVSSHMFCQWCNFGSPRRLRSQISELMMFNDNDVQEKKSGDIQRRFSTETPHLKTVKSNKELSCFIASRYKKGTPPSDFARLLQQKSQIAYREAFHSSQCIVPSHPVSGQRDLLRTLRAAHLPVTRTNSPSRASIRFFVARGLLQGNILRWLRVWF